jgi:hypothetical protein
MITAAKAIGHCKRARNRCIGFPAGDGRLFPRKWPARARCWSTARSILTRGC